MPTHLFLTLSTFTILLTTAPTLYLIHLHKTLSVTTSHKSTPKPIPFPPPHSSSPSSPFTHHMTSLPSSISSQRYIYIWDHAWKTIFLPSQSQSHSQLQSQPRKRLLTLYLRHTMLLFAQRLPQAYVLRMVVSVDARKTFGKEYIDDLEFEEGDLVCGIYRVVCRTDERVEFEILPVKGAGRVVRGARMGVEICEDVGGGVGGDDGEGFELNDHSVMSKVEGDGLKEKKRLRISNETLMWKDEGEKEKMPLEGGVGKWLHEIAAWWLLERGAGFLETLGKEGKGKES